MSNILRTWVSHNRNRFKDPSENVNVDLSYITDRIIAMAFPAPNGNFESVFRNNAQDVKRFLDKRHKGAYKVSFKITYIFYHISYQNM